jgi:hypothetical protein
MSGPAKRRRLRIEANFSEEVIFPPDEFLFEWAIGKFLILFQQLELHICAWLALHMRIDTNDLVVLLKDSNFNQKLSILENIFPRVDNRKGELKSLIHRLRAVNDFRNKIAHGLIVNSEQKLYLSMPSKDFMEFTERHLINPEIVMKNLSECRNISAYLVMHRMAGRIPRSPSPTESKS